MAVCLSISFNASIVRFTRSGAGWLVVGLTNCGVIQAASESADRLKAICPWFYNALYFQKLEMMYFIVESYFMEMKAFTVNPYSEEEIADMLINMLRF